MNKTTVIAQPLPYLPWQDRPAASGDVIWRYSANPIIPRSAICPGRIGQLQAAT